MQLEAVNTLDYLSARITKYLDDEGVEMTPTDTIYQVCRETGARRAVLLTELLDDLLFKLRPWFDVNARALRLKSDDTELVLRRLYTQGRKRALRDLYANLTFSSSDAALEPLIRWLRVVKGMSPEAPWTDGHHADVAVMQHFIWQVKRKMCGLPVTHHVMPILVGPQGSGKTTALSQLLSPVRPVVLSGTPLDSVGDERKFRLFSIHYVALFDEMARATKTDVDKLKECISASVQTNRTLHKETNGTYPQNCTFIGASNKSVQELIIDSTGMRRFYEIKYEGPTKITAEFKTTLWSQLPSKDEMLSCWRGVDESSEPDGYLLMKESIEKQQETIRSKSTVEEFIEEFRYQPSEKAKLTIANLYENYREFCVQSGISFALSKTSFSRALESLGFKKIRTSECIMFKIEPAIKTGVE